MHTWLVLQRLKKENKVNNDTGEMNDYEIIFIEITHNCAYNTTITCFIKIAIKLIAFIYTRNIGDHIKKKKKFSIIKQLTTKKLWKILIFLPSLHFTVGVWTYHATLDLVLWWFMELWLSGYGAMLHRPSRDERPVEIGHGLSSWNELLS